MGVVKVPTVVHVVVGDVVVKAPAMSNEVYRLHKRSVCCVCAGGAKAMNISPASLEREITTYAVAPCTASLEAPPCHLQWWTFRIT